MTTTAAPPAGAGQLLRHWRRLRRRTQLDLSLEADVSQRHLSWVETGRSRPSRELLLHLADVLDLPLRDRNALLQAGGYAAPYTQTAWDDPQLAPLREAVEVMLDRHMPQPAVVLDRHWELVDANPAAVELIGRFAGPDALAVARGNAMRLFLHPDGFRDAIVNFDEVGGHLAHRITREAASFPDDRQLAALADELVDLVGEVPRPAADAPSPMVVAVHLRRGDDEVALVSMLATIGGALDVTLSELVVELFWAVEPSMLARGQSRTMP